MMLKTSRANDGRMLSQNVGPFGLWQQKILPAAQQMTLPDLEMSSFTAAVAAATTKSILTRFKPLLEDINFVVSGCFQDGYKELEHSEVISWFDAEDGHTRCIKITTHGSHQYCVSDRITIVGHSMKQINREVVVVCAVLDDRTFVVDAPEHIVDGRSLRLRKRGHGGFALNERITSLGQKTAAYVLQQWAENSDEIMRDNIWSVVTELMRGELYEKLQSFAYTPTRLLIDADNIFVGIRKFPSLHKFGVETPGLKYGLSVSNQCESGFSTISNEAKRASASGAEHFSHTVAEIRQEPWFQELSVADVEAQLRNLDATERDLLKSGAKITYEQASSHWKFMSKFCRQERFWTKVGYLKAVFDRNTREKKKLPVKHRAPKKAKLLDGSATTIHPPACSQEAKDSDHNSGSDRSSDGGGDLSGDSSSDDDNAESSDGEFPVACVECLELFDCDQVAADSGLCSSCVGALDCNPDTNSDTATIDGLPAAPVGVGAHLVTDGISLVGVPKKGLAGDGSEISVYRGAVIEAVEGADKGRTLSVSRGSMVLVGLADEPDAIMEVCSIYLDSEGEAVFDGKFMLRARDRDYMPESMAEFFGQMHAEKEVVRDDRQLQMPLSIIMYQVKVLFWEHSYLQQKLIGLQNDSYFCRYATIIADDAEATMYPVKQKAWY